MNKKQYLARQELKKKIKQNKSLEKTGKLLSTKEKSIARVKKLHELFDFAPHCNTMFCESLNKEEF